MLRKVKRKITLFFLSFPRRRKSSCIKSSLPRQKGFSLIEAMISTAIVSIGFVGVYTLVAASEQLMKRSIARQKAQMVANQILEIVETDLDNIDSYGMGLKTCTNPGTSTNQYDIRGYQWCIRLQNEIGTAGTSDSRSITITTLADGRKVVHILLEGHSQKVQIVMKRVFDD